MVMKTAILTVGTRGSGKTTFCKKVKSLHPEVILLCRDDYFDEHFGRHTFDPLTGDIESAIESFWGYATKMILNSPVDSVFLIDFWTIYEFSRKKIIARLYDAGISEVRCWFFNTPLETNICWFIERETNVPNSKEFYEFCVRRDYWSFRENVSDILLRGVQEDDADNCQLDPKREWYRFHFDQIVVVNPITDPPELISI